MNIARKKATGIALMVASALMGAFGFTLIDTAQAASEYDPGFLIADGNMYTAPKMSAADIQRFLDDKGRNCHSGGGLTCLKDFRMRTASYAADRYCPNGYVSGGVETAAEIIYKVSKACNIAPEVILVTLQKEQSLITIPGDSLAYKASAGYNCPDNSPCAEADFGFQRQIYRGARQFQIYRLLPGDFNYRGQVTKWVGYNPNSSCGGSNVYMQTQATASLYNYTPYQPNSTVLKSGYVRSNSCGTYGNYNFVNYYRQWFGDPKVVRSAPKPAPVPAKPVTASIANKTGTLENLAKEQTGPVKSVEPVSQPVAKAVPTIASAVLANTKVAAGSSVLPNVTISFELVNLKPNQAPTVTLNGKPVENPGVANAEGKLAVKVNTGTGPELIFAVKDNDKEVGVFKAKVVAEIKPVEPAKKADDKVKAATTEAKPKPAEKPAPTNDAITINGEPMAKDKPLRAGDELTLRISGISQVDLENKTTELYFHSAEKVVIPKTGKWDQAKGVYVLNAKVPSTLANGKHGVYISVNNKETLLHGFTVNNPVENKAAPANAASSASAKTNPALAQTGAEAGVVFVLALMMLAGGLYLVIGAQQNRPIRVNC